jgi:hypothetical protein
MSLLDNFEEMFSSAVLIATLVRLVISLSVTQCRVTVESEVDNPVPVSDEPARV